MAEEAGGAFLMRVSFTIPGEPQPWRRARKNGKRHFKDPKTAAYQQQWAWAAAQVMRGSAPFVGALEAEVRCYFAVPVSASKAKASAMLAGEIRPTKRPDADNLAKSLDGLNGVAFKDDAQIVRLVSEKFYSLTPRVEVTIGPITNIEIRET